MIALGLSAHGCRPATEGMESPLTMAVGTYTGGTSRGIYTFRFDQESGECLALDSVETPNPSFLIFSADGRRVYSVNEMNDSTAALSTFLFYKSSGKLKPENTVLTHGAAPCHVSTNGRIVITSNYIGGSLSALPLHGDGEVKGHGLAQYFGEAHGVDSVRQITPHVHCTAFSPDGRYLLASDFSADRILRFRLTEGRDSLLADGTAAEVEPGSGPRHLTFAPDGRHVYLINELSGMVTAFRYADGQLEQTQSIVADSLHARGSADIHLSPDGRFLYASNRLKGDGIAIFTVDKKDGTLAPAGYQPTAAHPRNFAITPNGKFLLAACRDGNVIQVFRRGPQTGLLTNTQRDIRLSMPVCIQFAP